MVAAVVLLLAQVAGCAACGPDRSQEVQRRPAPRRPQRSAERFAIVSGSVVPGATIAVRDGSTEQQTVSGPDGRFTLHASTSSRHRPHRTGDRIRRAASHGAGRNVGASVDLVLSPASVQEAVTVTATRSERRTGDVPASVNVLDREDIKQSPALVADDLLRQIPTFSLFRRTSSLASHPTAQGVSLRGIGPSGVSRTLVLVDGVPNNDPFGGWVYWSRVPLESSERIEVVDSSSSSLYGNYAMGGVINFVTNPPTAKTFDVKAQYGSRSTPKLDFLASHVWGKLGVTVDGNIFDTDGYPIVRASERGKVDNNAAGGVLESEPQGGLHAERTDACVRYASGTSTRTATTARPARSTAPKKPTTRFGAPTAAACASRMPDQSELQATVFTDFETFHSNFLAVPASTPPRNVGRMTLTQTSADPQRRCEWSSGRERLAQNSTSQPDPTFAGSTATARKTDSTRRPARKSRSLRNSGGTQRNVGVFRSGSDHPNLATDGDVERSCGRLAQLRRPQPRNQPDWRAGQQRAVAAGPQRHGRESARRRAVPPHQPRRCVGGHRLGLPRARR